MGSMSRARNGIFCLRPIIAFIGMYFCKRAICFRLSGSLDQPRCSHSHARNGHARSEG